MALNRLIYLDYNSTTPIDPRVLDAMLPFLKDNFANPSSTHHFGQSINEKVKEAREQSANFINAEPNELIFTSGATEAINLAIKGVAASYSAKGKHIITVATEHKAVLDTCKDLEKKGFEVTYLPVQKNGLIDLAELQKAIRTDTILVSVMYVNNETGVIQPIKEIAKLAHDKGALFMTDATQAVGKIEIDVNDLGIDLLCFSGHKMYAPKGIGALYVKNKVKLTPQVHGGGHEQGLRSGTLNVPGIIALAKSCEIASEEMTLNQKKIAALRDKLETELLKLPNTSINGIIENRIFNTTNICFKGQDANVLIGRMKNIAVSNGSACSSAVVEPSHVLKAMGLSDEEAFASLRFSLGKYNTDEDVDIVVSKLNELIN
ncbi:cysteine desulfurase family protein [Flavobacterium branchiophilum]|uniref:cysteine desulfurase n=1 Tax=Flavobacterium branchiophilum TaxID=55197 RepID=A0A2H3K9V8_9FLAO|nr:cysteine desulfurase family protein [Flavobacterium branchiophilum]PDS23123.1 IscS subfamily cysteine desulfurase [Flavobacterium branchiophilum]